MFVKKTLQLSGLLLFSVISFSVFAANSPIKAQLPDGDKLIYGRLLEAYRQQKVKDVVDQKNLLLKNYPGSIHTDNALYLSGLLQIQKNRIPEGLKDLSNLEKNFPKSLKRPSAMFAKALAYQKMNLPVQQKSVLQSIVKNYAGSLESQKAWVELRLIKEGKVKR